MKDPWNPSVHELRDWAYDAQSLWPDQDFDLSVAEIVFSDLIIELICDDVCPKQDFFLSCAYLLVGDAVLTEYRTRSRQEVTLFIEKLKSTRNENAVALYDRAVELMENPLAFDYDLWCCGGYVTALKKHE